MSFEDDLRNFARSPDPLRDSYDPSTRSWEMNTGSPLERPFEIPGLKIPGSEEDKSLEGFYRKSGHSVDWSFEDLKAWTRKYAPPGTMFDGKGKLDTEYISILGGLKKEVNKRREEDK